MGRVLGLLLLFLLLLGVGHGLPREGGAEPLVPDEERDAIRVKGCGVSTGLEEEVANLLFCFLLRLPISTVDGKHFSKLGLVRVGDSLLTEALDMVIDLVREDQLVNIRACEGDVCHIIQEACNIRTIFATGSGLEEVPVL